MVTYDKALKKIIDKYRNVYKGLLGGVVGDNKRVSVTLDNDATVDAINLSNNFLPGSEVICGQDSNGVWYVLPTVEYKNVAFQPHSVENHTLANTEKKKKKIFTTVAPTSGITKKVRIGTLFDQSRLYYQDARPYILNTDSGISNMANSTQDLISEGYEIITYSGTFTYQNLIDDNIDIFYAPLFRFGLDGFCTGSTQGYIRPAEPAKPGSPSICETYQGYTIPGYCVDIPAIPAYCITYAAIPPQPATPDVVVPPVIIPPREVPPQRLPIPDDTTDLGGGQIMCDPPIPDADCVAQCNNVYNQQINICSNLRDQCIANIPVDPYNPYSNYEQQVRACYTQEQQCRLLAQQQLDACTTTCELIPGECYLFIPGYTIPGYTIPGYTIPGRSAFPGVPERQDCFTAVDATQKCFPPVNMYGGEGGSEIICSPEILPTPEVPEQFIPPSPGQCFSGSPPGVRYSQDEINALEKFVKEDGKSLFLQGERTPWANQSIAVTPLSSRFGFINKPDALIRWIKYNPTLNHPIINGVGTIFPDVSGEVQVVNPFNYPVSNLSVYRREMNINDIKVTEGRSAQFTVTLAELIDERVEANVIIEADTAIPGIDYIDLISPQRIVFPPLTRFIHLNVSTLISNSTEEFKTFRVRIFNATTGVIINKGIGEARIYNISHPNYADPMSYIYLMKADVQANKPTLAASIFDGKGKVVYAGDVNVWSRLYDINRNAHKILWLNIYKWLEP